MSGALKLVKNQNYSPVTADILRRLMIQNRELKTDDPKLTEEKWINSDEYGDIKQKWIQVVMNEIEHGNLLESVHASHVFFMLYRVAEGAIKDLFQKWVNQADGIEKIAKLIGRSGSDSTNGPYCKIEKDFISKFIDYKIIKECVDTELSSGKELSNYLKAVYLSISTGDTYYLNDATKGQKF